MSRSKRGILAIAGGAAGGQVIGLIAAPIISRIYSADVFGDFATIQAIAAVLVPLATLRLQYALLRPEDDRTVKSLLVLGLFASSSISVVAAIGAKLFYGLLDPSSIVASWHGAVWIALMTWATSLLTLISQVALRDHKYGSVGLRQVTQYGSTSAIQIGVGFFNNAVHFGLTLGRVAGLLLSCVPLFGPARRYLGVSGSTRLSVMAKEYWRFPIVFTPSALLNVLGTQLPLLIVSGVYAADVVGQLGMAQKIAMLPLGLIGMAVSQVFASEIASRVREGRKGITRPFLRMAAALSVAGLLITIGLLAFGPAAFSTFLGPGWHTAGIMAQVMAVSIGLGIVVSPLSTLLIVLNESSMTLCLDIFRVVLLFVSFAVVNRLTESPITVIFAMYLAQATVYLITFLCLLIVVRRYDQISA